MAKFMVVAVLTAAIVGSWASPAEEKLIQTLLANYESNSRPVVHVKDTLMVNLNYEPIKLTSMDVDENEMMVYGWMKMSWRDAQLTWNASDHDGITVLNLPIESLWKPDIKLYNAHESSIDNTLALVQSNGTIIWVPPLTSQVSCKLNPFWYPFDVQRCSLIFGSWTFDKTQIDLQIYKSDSEENIFNVNKEWQLISTDAVRHEKKYACCDNPYPNVEVTMTLKRKACRKIMEQVLPMATVVVLSFLTMMVPATRSDIRLLVITLLLGFALTTLQGTHSTIPQSVSLLSLLNGLFVFILACLFLCNCIYLAFLRGQMDCSFLAKLSGFVGAKTGASPEKSPESTLILNVEQRADQRTLDSLFTMPLALLAVFAMLLFLAVPLF